MAECNITSVDVVNNPGRFTDPIVLDVQYECLSSLQDDLEWKVVYLGSAEDGADDQVLDSALVGPVQQGNFKFRMEAPAPDPSRIPFKDLLGLTGLLLTCSYKGSEFVRVGWYVHIEYTDPDVDLEHPPNPPRIDQLQRNILADQPRVTKYPHDFDNPPAPVPLEAEPEADDLLPDDDLEGGDDEYDEDEDLDDEQGGMLEEEDIGEEVENRDPKGPMALGGMMVQGKAGLEAAVADAGAGVEDMEL